MKVIPKDNEEAALEVALTRLEAIELIQYLAEELTNLEAEQIKLPIFDDK